MGVSDQPVHKPGAAAGWAATHWTAELLAERVGSVRATVHTGRWERRRLRVRRAGASREVAAAAWLRAFGRGEAEGYLAGPELLKQVPELRGDLRLPAVGPLKVDVLWVGPTGTETPLHFDLAPNLVVQLSGRKRWRLYAPHHALRPRFSGLQGLFLTSDLDVHDGLDAAGPPDLDLVLEPGDALYVPSRWWHRVDALEPSIAVNRWWWMHSLSEDAW